MMKRLLILLLLSSLLTTVSSADEEVEVEDHPLLLGGFNELGNLERGVFSGDKNELKEIPDEWVDHIGLYVLKSYTVDQRWDLNVGVAGSFQFRKPETGRRGAGFAFQQRKAFFGAAFGDLNYKFGDLDAPYLSIKFGDFGYKYNADAKNLGEYLFRSLPYPSYTFTGGYQVVNNATAYVQGVKASFMVENLSLDLFILSEMNYAPLYNMGPAAVANYKLGGGVFEFGTGFYWKGLIKVDDSEKLKDLKNNAYFTFNDIPVVDSLMGDTAYGPETYVKNADYYYGPASFHSNKTAFYDSVIADSPNPEAIAKRHYHDSLSMLYQGKGSRMEELYLNYLDFQNDPTSVDPALVPDVKFFDAEGLLLMAKASFDVKKLFGSPEIFGPHDLKIFGELAVLGWKNYPIIYTERKNRMPIMFGFNIPGFNFFDIISLQGEYWDNPYMNDVITIQDGEGYLPRFINGGDSFISDESYMDITDNNFKWSLYTAKTMGRITLHGQIASDHLNLTGENYSGPNWESGEITRAKDHWYWMFQISWDLN